MKSREFPAASELCREIISSNQGESDKNKKNNRFAARRSSDKIHLLIKHITKKHREHIKFQTLDIQIPTYCIDFRCLGHDFVPQTPPHPGINNICLTWMWWTWPPADTPLVLSTPSTAKQLWASIKKMGISTWKDPMFRQISIILENQSFFSRDSKMSQIVHLESQTWTTMRCFVFPQQGQC